ncbi:hypothetical protein DM02DRAFT_612059 [Periconia macrospinosa]|uniref:FAR-17a/AIG1-like protein n=1 Tax=Periconia macrospinosa TaxID=97972 RepID=A0A2V1DZX3_9PLEO|nr:hypothetical protein DM02DRAFT_612059 [Periconia macrospinosa]
MPFFKRSSREPGFDPTFRFATSWILPPAVLFFIRAALSLYAFTTLFFILAWRSVTGGDGGKTEARHSFSYFTVLTYWGLAFYYAFAAAHTLSYWRTGTPLLARWPRALKEAHSVYYSTIVIYPFIVTAVFWALLAPEDGFPSIFETWTNTSQHAMNAAYALFEIIFPRTEPLPFWHLIPVVILLAMYLGLAYVTYYTQGFYVYSFLDLQKNSRGIVAAYIVGILVAAIIVFLIVKYVIMLRVWVTEKKMGKMGKRSARDVKRRHVDEEGGTHYPLHSVNFK